MADMKPILFNTEMVRNILEERKTVTRRVVKTPWYIEDEDVSRVSGYAMHRGYDYTHGMPYLDSIYHPGDILYVRETWTKLVGSYLYKANQKPGMKHPGKWNPSIHMPKEAARIFLRVTDVRLERLHEMKTADFKSEGIRPKRPEGWPGNGCDCAWKHDGCLEAPCPNRDGYFYWCYAEPFERMWDSTIKPADRALYGWVANPWVWVIAFERIGKEAGL